MRKYLILAAYGFVLVFLGLEFRLDNHIFLDARKLLPFWDFITHFLLIISHLSIHLLVIAVG
jgi:hypothetical protein